MTETLHADYLVIGAGAMGMAFVDTLISDTEASIIIVDRYDQPGGHWTIAYPFVRLHQPSAFYGVNSRHLGQDKIDQVGWNKGLAELATGLEVTAYYGTVMHQTFLPSGRVLYFPKHEYTGDGSFRSVLTGELYQVSAETKIVDGTRMKVQVPAMRPPPYEIAAGVDLITPNKLPQVARPYKAYTVVGAGKTGIDACLWLLSSGIDTEKISWIMPRDSWFLERTRLQPRSSAFAESNGAFVVDFSNAIEAASSPEDLFLRLEKSGQITRLTDKIWPTMFRCATVSFAELEQLRRIGHVIRQGRVVRVTLDQVTMEQGDYRPCPDTLYIDCTADGLAKLEPVPVFSGRNINLQSLRTCQQVFSAAVIAHVEATYPEEARKNDLCTVVPHPDKPEDYMSITLQSNRNGLKWSQEPQTAAWLARCRLDLFGRLLPPAPADPAEAAAFYAAVGKDLVGSCEKLELLIDQLPQEAAAKAKTQQA